MSDLQEYDYDLPDELIAQSPVERRDNSRLMVVDRKRGAIEHALVRDLPTFLKSTDTMVVNNTRVVPARLVGHRISTGGKWQGLFLKHDTSGLWEVLSKTRGKIHPGERVRLMMADGTDGVELEMVARLEGGAWAVKPMSQDDWHDVLDLHGRVPLPPYIRSGEMVDEDRDRYQTVYASTPGAVAAPTAGLHFTPALLEDIEAKISAIESVTLHVGIGTFRPVSVESFQEHKMHHEWCELTAECAERLRTVRNSGSRIMAVGTTTVRTLESASRSGELQELSGETDLFIYPPYEFTSVDLMMTNFHLPKSTLLVLVSAFAGKELIREAYAKAIEERYRFFSYGDAMLLM